MVGWSPDRKSVVEGVTGVQTCALPISIVGRSGPMASGSAWWTRTTKARRPVTRRASHIHGWLVARSEERRGGSDWSSDVCSSDLYRWKKRSDGKWKCMVDTYNKGSSAGDTAGFPHSWLVGRQIGRASWRE